jgi:DNA-binding LacI/PurR family transcriptional regulator
MNIRAVAKLANVSTATVSRTINEPNKVSPETAKRVRQAIKLTNFYPNTNARALGSGRSNLYGLIISDITNPFFPELVKAFEDLAVEHDQEVLIANTNYDAERIKVCVTRMLQRKVDGVAIMTSEMDENLVTVFSKQQIPLVFLDIGTPSPGVSCVRIDYPAGVELAMSHLVGLGHRRIAFLSGPLGLKSARARLEAFRKSRARHRLKIDARMIEEGNHRIDGGHEAMRRILSSGVRPTAVFASNDMTAIGAMGAIAGFGLHVPDDISVIGFDDIQLSAFTIPPLTTVRLSRAEIAEKAFHILLDAWVPKDAKPKKGQEHLLTPTLVLRQSTGPVQSSVP